MSVAREYVLKGGIDYAKKMLMNAFGPEHAKKMVDRLVKTLGSETASFDTLQKADPQQLAKFIHNEHPQTIALILSHLNASQAAGLLISLPMGVVAQPQPLLPGGHAFVQSAFDVHDFGPPPVPPVTVPFQQRWMKG